MTYVFLIYMSKEVAGLSGDAFTLHCYRTLLEREPEFEFPVIEWSIDEKIDYLFEIIGSLEFKLRPGMTYLVALRSLALALGHGQASSFVIGQVVSQFPTFEDFWSGLDYLKEEVRRETRGGSPVSLETLLDEVRNLSQRCATMESALAQHEITLEKLVSTVSEK